MKTIQLLFFTLAIAISCVAQKTPTIVGREYNEKRNQTNYFVLPFGSTSIPGKWTKGKYNEISNQQFFKNNDSISIAVAFTPINGYEFNTKKTKKGFEFTKAFYKWDSEYFVNNYKLDQAQIELDENQNYIIWRAFGELNHASFDTYFLFGEKNGYANNFSITKTDKWTKQEKIKILKEMYLGK